MNVLPALARSSGALVLALCSMPTQQATPAAETVELAYRNVDGRTLPWRFETSGEIVVYKESGSTPEESLTMSGSIDVDRIDAPMDADGRLAFLLHLRRMEMSFTTSGTTQTFRMSAEGIEEGGVLQRPGDDAGLAEMLDLLFGSPLEKLRMPSRGDVVEVTYLGTPALQSEFDAIQSGQDLMLFHPVLPPGPVKLRERWQGKRPVRNQYEFPEAIQLEYDYTLASIEGGIATLRMRGEFQSKEKRRGRFNDKPATFTYLRYEQTGEVRFHVADGALESGEITLTMGGILRSPTEKSAGLRFHAPMRYTIARRPVDSPPKKAAK